MAEIVFLHHTAMKFNLLLVKQVNFIVDLDHGVHQPVWDLHVPQNLQYVLLLVHSLWMTDVSDMDQKILEAQES